MSDATGPLDRGGLLDAGGFTDALAVARRAAWMTVPVPVCGHGEAWWVATSSAIECIVCGPALAPRDGTLGP